MKNNKSVPKVLNTKIISVFVMIVSLISIGCQSKTVVKKLTNSAKVNKKTETNLITGSIYHLPLTVVKVSIPLKMNTQTPGEFSDFTPCYFSPEEADRRIKTGKKVMSIDVPTFSSYGRADLEETFVVKTTGSYFESRTVSMTLSKDGSLTEGSIESKDETIPIAIKIAETAIGLGIKVATAGVGIPFNPAFNNVIPSNSDDFVPEPQFLEDKVNELLTKGKNCYKQGFQYQIEKITRKIDESNSEKDQLESEKERREENKEKIEQIKKLIVNLRKELTDLEKRLTIAKKNMDNLVDEKNTWKREEKFRSPASLYIKFVNAQKNYDDLKELQGQREILLDNLANIDPEIYKTRLKELDDKIKPLTESFFGEKETFVWTGNFELNPAKTTGKNFKSLFTYSKSDGICYNDKFKESLAADGILVPEEFQFDKCSAEDKDRQLTQLQLYADRQDNDTVFINNVNAAKAQAPKDISSGWYFRIPARANIALIQCKGMSATRCDTNLTEYGRQEIMIAQYGAVVSLPAKTAGRSSSSTISLDETTGALKNFKVSSSPLIDKSTIEGIGKTGEALIDADDPLTRKKRELEFRKTENDITEQIKRASNLSNSNSQP